MSNWHRIRTNRIRTDPSIVSVNTNFFWSDVERVVFVRQFVHLTSHDIFFHAIDVKHILAELFVADESVVGTQEELILAILLERIRDEVLVISWLLPVTVSVVSSFPFIVIRNREEIHGVLDKFLVLLRSVSQEVPARAVDDASQRPSTRGILCIVLLAQYRVPRIVQCFQLP